MKVVTMAAAMLARPSPLLYLSARNSERCVSRTRMGVPPCQQTGQPSTIIARWSSKILCQPSPLFWVCLYHGTVLGRLWASCEGCGLTKPRTTKSSHETRNSSGGSRTPFSVTQLLMTINILGPIRVITTLRSLTPARTAKTPCKDWPAR